MTIRVNNLMKKSKITKMWEIVAEAVAFTGRMTMCVHRQEFARFRAVSVRPVNRSWLEIMGTA